jgi:DNA-binding GntR family transcriptional regulator
MQPLKEVAMTARAADARNNTKTTRLYHELREEVVSGAIPPGSRLVLTRLAERFGTSEIPVREALRLLQNDGLVVFDPYIGARVRIYSPEEVDEVFLIRAALESVATRVSVRYASLDLISKLESAVKAMDELVTTSRLGEYGRSNRAFHDTIFSASPYSRLHEDINRLWTGSEWTRAVFNRSPERAAESNREHQAIIDAIKAQDERAAGELAYQHKLNAGRALAQALHHTRTPTKTAQQTTESLSTLGTEATKRVGNR